MRTKIPLSIIISMLVVNLQAAQDEEPRERVTSVKKVITSVAGSKEKEVKIVPDILPEATQTTQEGVPRERFYSVKKAISGVSATPQKELDIVGGFKHMFHDGKVTGQIRALSSAYMNDTYQNTYATALGGFVKYELAQYKGFSAAVTFHTSTDIDAFSGEGVKRNTDLSSSAQEYEVRSETYINYSYDDFSIRIGRQVIDTPLADSDDFLMIPNSFKAVVALYEDDKLTVMAGELQEWQGFDADLDNGWQKTGKDGTYFGGLSYSDERVDTNLWVYNINGEAGDTTANNSFYADIVGHYHISETFFAHAGLQFLKQNELDSSGVASNIYGATGELVVDGLGFNIAYNHAAKEVNKQSFSGFGGGTLFTSMDSMILDAITLDRSADAWVGGISYEIGDFNILYAYGDFHGDADSSGAKEHIVEQNFGAEYSRDDDFTLAAIYTINDDKYDNSANGINGGDWGNVRIFGAYNF